MQKAVFLDRDGVINQTIFRRGKPRAPYTLEEFEFIEGVQEASELLKRHGFALIVVTNQPDVARGWVKKIQVDLVNRHIQDSLPIDGLKTCFHDNGENCECRKPRPGMLLEASQDFSLDLSQSYMVGDRGGDILAGKAAGCKTILVGEHPEGETDKISPDHKCRDLLNAAKWIIQSAER